MAEDECEDEAVDSDYDLDSDNVEYQEENSATDQDGEESDFEEETSDCYIGKDNTLSGTRDLQQQE